MGTNADKLNNAKWCSSIANHRHEWIVASTLIAATAHHVNDLICTNCFARINIHEIGLIAQEISALENLDKVL